MTAYVSGEVGAGLTAVRRPAGPDEPDAAWATVCFSPPAPARDDGTRAARSASAVWRTAAAHGPVLVRLYAPFPVAAHRGYGPPPPCRHAPGRLPCDVHLWADADRSRRSGPGLADCADVLVSPAPLPLPAARGRVRELLARHPGCLAAASASGTGCVVGVRTGAGGPRYVRLACDGTWGHAAPRVAASVVHAWTVAGRPPAALRSLTAAQLPVRAYGRYA
ncbi:hypothetical protein [Streptomyces sp. enrichment culture]|uniref:hypothetical protein n=1 Tax=Streptomyces sp. enrichment culture TaxID=1795815 RepID=UPI003F544902